MRKSLKNDASKGLDATVCVVKMKQASSGLSMFASANPNTASLPKTSAEVSSHLQRQRSIDQNSNARPAN